METPADFYTTSSAMGIEDFIDTEVHERENYGLEDVIEWIEKYGITKSTKLIWVTPKPHIAARYQMPAEDWEDAEKLYDANPDAFDVRTIRASDGFVIPESDDGDDGFIFALNQ